MPYGVSGSCFLETEFGSYTGVGGWHIHFQCVLGLSEGTDLLMVEFSLVKWHKCLGCHIVKGKGTCMDVNLRIL